MNKQNKQKSFIDILVRNKFMVTEEERGGGMRGW